ncbi:hypothetical protein T10_2130, partial [Trichinella papuae]
LDDGCLLGDGQAQASFIRSSKTGDAIFVYVFCSTRPRTSSPKLKIKKKVNEIEKRNTIYFIFLFITSPKKLILLWLL